MAKFLTACLSALLFTAGQAWAQAEPPAGPEVDEATVPEAPDDETAAEETVVPTRAERAAPAPGNLSLSLGLGVSNFRGDLNDNLNAGASWDVRAGFKNDSWVSGELAYIGSANGIDDKGGDLGPNVDGTALSSMGDALVRFNATTKRSWQPYAGAGIGMLSLNVRDDDTTVDRGSALTLPLTAGVDFYASRRMLIGGRFNYRVLTDVVDNDIPDGDQWNAGLSIGATF